jgi:hypothetical protein
MFPLGYTVQPAEPAWEPGEPPHASMACRNEDAAEPVGRACGVALLLPPPPPLPDSGPPPLPWGRLTPCCSRHLRKVVLCVVPDPELEPDPDPDPEPVAAELPEHPATVTAATSTSAPNAAGLMAPGPRLLPAALNRRIKGFLLAAHGRRVPRPPAGPAAPHLQSRRRALRSRCSCHTDSSGVSERS